MHVHTAILIAFVRDSGQQARGTSMLNLNLELRHIFYNGIFFKTYEEVPDVCSVVI